MKWAKRIDIVECSFTKMFLEGLVLNIANFSQSFLTNVESGKKAEVEMFTKILFILTIIEIILIMDKESLDL